MRSSINRLLRSLFLLLICTSAALPLSGCDALTAICQQSGLCGSAATNPGNAPGTVSYYSIMDFTSQSTLGCLISSDDGQSCDSLLRDEFAVPLNWSISVGDLDDYYYRPSNPTTASQFNTDAPNLMYVSSHGGIDTGVAQICLRNCDGSTVGGTSSFGPQTLPQRWNGPNWLVIDACNVVQPNVGWEGIFGGRLHGIFGFNASVHGLATSGLNLFAKELQGFDTAMNAWDKATMTTEDSIFATALIPTPNTADIIEGSGPGFGPNGDTSPAYFRISNGSWGPGVATQLPATSAAPLQTSYSLTPEQMDESYWYNTYGGTSLTGLITHPSSNENLYRDQNVTVDHFLATGGLLVAAQRTGTAKGVAEADAYSYALNWLSSNGGLPADAVLTYAGGQTNSLLSPTPPDASVPYPNVTQYVFVWRHGSSGLVGSDKIEIRIDDAGFLSKQTIQIYNTRCQCYVNQVINTYPWQQRFHMHAYARMWRQIGAPLSDRRNTMSYNSGSYGLCGTEFADPTSTGVPCAVTNGTGGHVFVDTTNSQAIYMGE